MNDGNKKNESGRKIIRHDGYTPSLEYGYRPILEERGYSPTSTSGKPSAPPPPPTSGSNVVKPKVNDNVSTAGEKK